MGVESQESRALGLGDQAVVRVEVELGEGLLSVSVDGGEDTERFETRCNMEFIWIVNH
jgi:hypothetical protein